MTRYTLKDEGYPFKKIMCGKRWVGRVYKNEADGTWGGHSGTIRTKGHPTAVAAFEQVAAECMGYPSAAALRARNSQVSAQNRAARQEAQYAAQELMRGNFRPLDELFKKGAR